MFRSRIQPLAYWARIQPFAYCPSCFERLCVPPVFFWVSLTFLSLFLYVLTPFRPSVLPWTSSLTSRPSLAVDLNLKRLEEQEVLRDFGMVRGAKRLGGGGEASVGRGGIRRDELCVGESLYGSLYGMLCGLLCCVVVRRLSSFSLSLFAPPLSLFAPPLSLFAPPLSLSLSLFSDYGFPEGRFDSRHIVLKLNSKEGA